MEVAAAEVGGAAASPASASLPESAPLTTTAVSPGPNPRGLNAVEAAAVAAAGADAADAAARAAVAAAASACADVLADFIFRPIPAAATIATTAKPISGHRARLPFAAAGEARDKEARGLDPAAGADLLARLVVVRSPDVAVLPVLDVVSRVAAVI